MPRINTKKETNRSYSTLAIIVASLLALVASYSLFSKDKYEFVSATISHRSFEMGMIQCRRARAKPSTPPPVRLENPRFKIPSARSTSNSTVFIIQRATLLDGDGTIRGGMSIVLLNGLVHAVSNSSHCPRKIAFATGIPIHQIKVIDVANHYVTPGLVDMHSHAGTDSWPGLSATDDTNEMTSTPVTPYLRAIDGFNPHDPAIQIINAGGVTSSLILPGSGNLIGGEALMIKLRKPSSNRIKDMLIYANANETTDGKLWRHMKMACGENAKDVYGSQGIMPGSRLGEGFLFRDQFNSARNLKEAQDDWCTLADNAIDHAGEYHAYLIMKTAYPSNIKFDSLVALLRNEVKLQNHCYEVSS